MATLTSFNELGGAVGDDFEGLVIIAIIADGEYIWEPQDDGGSGGGGAGTFFTTRNQITGGLIAGRAFIGFYGQSPNNFHNVESWLAAPPVTFGVTFPFARPHEEISNGLIVPANGNLFIELNCSVKTGNSQPALASGDFKFLIYRNTETEMTATTGNLTPNLLGTVSVGAIDLTSNVFLSTTQNMGAVSRGDSLIFVVLNDSASATWQENQVRWSFTLRIE